MIPCLYIKCFPCFFFYGSSLFHCMCVCSVVSNSVTPWTVAHQAPLFMGFLKQEYWSGLPFPPPIPLYAAAAAAAKSLQSCLTLCDPIDGSPPGSPVPGILKARTLEWVAIFFSNAWKWKVKVKSLSCVWLLATLWMQLNLRKCFAQSCLTLCDPMDTSPPGSSVHGILQARILEWISNSFSRGSSQPRDWPWSPALQADSLVSEPPCHLMDIKFFTTFWT